MLREKNIILMHIFRARSAKVDWRDFFLVLHYLDLQFLSGICGIKWRKNHLRPSIDCLSFLNCKSGLNLLHNCNFISFKSSCVRFGELFPSLETER